MPADRRIVSVKGMEATMKINDIPRIASPGSGDAAVAKSVAASELRYRRLFESAKDGILILDAETGMIVDVNPFLTKMLGFSLEEFLGKRVWELGFFKNLAANEEKFAELQAKEYVRYEDLPLKTVDGQIREVEFVSNVYLADGKRVIQCNIRDITERKRVEAYRDLRQEVCRY
jgi:PAS domain S-box-containing protein